MSCASSPSPKLRRQHSAPGLVCTDKKSKPTSPKYKRQNSGSSWSAPSSDFPSSPRSKRAASPLRQLHFFDPQDELRRQISSGQRSEASSSASPISPLSPKSPKGIDKKHLSIVVDATTNCRQPSKQSQGSSNSKDRNLERKALNVQLLPSELEQVQNFLQNDDPSKAGSFSDSGSNQGISPFVERLQELLASNKFNASIGGLILLNTVFMGLELDQHPIADSSEIMVTFWEVPRIPQDVFDGIEVAFFIVFGLEMFLRFVVSGRALFKEFTTYIDMAALAPVLLVFLFDVQSSKQLTLLRVFRLLKLTRISRLIRLSRELSVLVRSIASSLRSLMWIGVLLLIVVYCSAITCTMLIGHDSHFSDDNEQILLYEEVYKRHVSVGRYWGSTMRSMVTLFQVFTLDDWSGIARPVIETHSPAMILFFVFFIFLTTFGLLNLLMGTIVDHSVSAHKDAELEKERLLQDEHKQIMIITLKLFSLMDLDGNGKLSSTEMLIFFKEHNLESLLQEDLDHFKVKIDYQELLDMCLSIADAWQTDGEGDDDGITMEEFAGAAMRLRGAARSRDLLSVHVLTKSTMSRVASCENTLTEHGQIMSTMSNKLDRILELLSDGSAESMMCPECGDKGSKCRRARGTGTSSKREAKSPKRKSRSPLRQYKALKHNLERMLHAAPALALEDESTSAESKSGKQVVDMDGPGDPYCISSRSSSEKQLPTTDGSPNNASEKLKQVHEERMAAGMQSGMFGHEKVSSFVQQLMTTMPEFANTQSGAAIKNYTMKRSMSKTLEKEEGSPLEQRRRGSEPVSGQAHVVKGNEAGAMRSPMGSRLRRQRIGKGSDLTIDVAKAKVEHNLPLLSPGWLGSKLRRSSTSDQLRPTERRRKSLLSAPATSFQSAPAALGFQSPLPGQCIQASTASS